MKKLYFVSLFFCLSISWAQVGINTTAPSAQLDVRSSNQATPSNTDGILIPKVDTFPATNPTIAQQGMLVYLTTTVGINQPGYYYWDNPTTTWISFGNNNNNWRTVGNTGTNATTNFIGTTDNVDLVFKRFNELSGKIANSNTFFGRLSGSVSTGLNNTYLGTESGRDNTSGNNNVFIGRRAGTFGVGGSDNTFVGNAAGILNTANQNTFVGSFSGNGNSTGVNNSFFGFSSGTNNGIGSQNTYLGTFAGNTNSGNIGNTFVGANTNSVSNGLTNASAIGFNAQVGASNSIILGSVNGVNSATASTSVGIGTTIPNGVFDVSSTTNGILIPRVALTNVLLQAPIVNPQGGALPPSTMVYNTATAGASPNNVYPGFYYWNGTRWIRFDVNGENNPKYYTAIGTTNASSPPTGGLTPIPEMQVTLTPKDSVILVNFSAAGFSANGACGQGGIFFQITLNGVPVKGWQTSVENIINVPDRPLWDTTISYPITVTPGIPQTIQVLWYFPLCPNLPFNLVAAPMAVAAGATYQAYRTLTVIDPNGGGGIIGSPPVTTNMWSQLGNTGTNAAVNFVGTSDAQPLVLKSNNLDGIIINTNGNVGLGTSIPATKLHIAGNIRIADGTQSAGRVLTSDVNGTASWQNASNNAWGLFGNSGTNATTNFIGTTDNQSLAFRTNNVERLFLSDIGNVGVGTITPARKLHVFNGASGGTSNANTGLLMESNLNQYQHFLSPSATEGGFLFGSELASISGGIIFNNPSTLNGFQFRTGGNSSRMAITNAGDVGIATVAPSERLELGSGNISVLSGDIYLGNLNGVFNAGGGLMSALVNYIGDIYVAPTQVNGDEDLYIADVLELGGQGYKPGGGAWVAPSDRRLKRNIEPYTDGLESLLKINPVTYKYNNLFKTLDTGETYVGVIAQEVQKIAPYMVEEKPFGQIVKEDENGKEIITNPGTPYLTFDSSALTYMLINSVKELDSKNNKLQQENEALKAKVSQQEKLMQSIVDRLTALENK